MFYGWRKVIKKLDRLHRLRSRNGQAPLGRGRPHIERLEDRTLLNFGTAVTYDTYQPRRRPDSPFTDADGAFPFAVALGDFRGIGVKDIVTADTNDIPGSPREGVISVFLGNKDGTFQPPILYHTGGFFPRAVAVGRFTRDTPSHLDIVVVNRNDLNPLESQGNLGFLEGNGDGTFRPARTMLAGLLPFGVATTDFNEDGLDDVVVTNNFTPGSGVSSEVGVFISNGNGTFQPRLRVPLRDATNRDASLPIAVAVGNFGNGHVGFVTADFGGVCQAVGNVCVPVKGLEGGAITIVQGNGNGTFQTPRHFSTQQPDTFFTGLRPRSVSVADFDNDGKLDVVTANNDSDDVTVLYGNGLGGIASTVSFFAGSRPTWVAVGDLNSDGKTDIVVTNGEDSRQHTNTVTVLLGNPNPILPEHQDAFPTVRSYLVGEIPTGVAIGKLGGVGRLGQRDDILDLVVANSGTVAVSPGDRGSVSILYGNPDLSTDPQLPRHGNGTFPAPTIGGTPSDSQPVSMAVGDLNGDGWLDVVTANSLSDNLSVFLNDGLHPGRNFHVLFADAFEDPLPLRPIGRNPETVVLGHFAHANRLDIAVANRGECPRRGTLEELLNCRGTQGSVTVFENTGIQKFPFTNNERFVRFVALPASTYIRSMVAGNFHTGRPELDVAVLWENPVLNRGRETYGIFVLTGNGNGGFEAVTETRFGITDVENPAALAVGHFFDGSPNLDLALVDNVSNPGLNCLKILRGNGNGTFARDGAFRSGSNCTGLAVAKLRPGSPHDDVIVTNETYPGSVAVLLGNGNGTFENARGYPAGTNPVAVAVADFNHDGKLDLAVADFNSDTVTVLLGNGNGTFQASKLDNQGRPIPEDPRGQECTFGDRNCLVRLPTHYVTGGRPVGVAARSFRNPESLGYPDIMTVNERSGTVTLLLNDRMWPRPEGTPLGSSDSSVDVPDDESPPASDGLAALVATTLDVAAFTETDIIFAQFSKNDVDLGSASLQPDLVGLIADDWDNFVHSYRSLPLMEENVSELLDKI